MKISEVHTTFASRDADRFGSAPWSMTDALPRLDDVAGWAACKLWRTVEAGDHLLLIGEVHHASSEPRPPLVYGHRTFGTHSHFATSPGPASIDQISA